MSTSYHDLMRSLAGPVSAMPSPSPYKLRVILGDNGAIRFACKKVLEDPSGDPDLATETDFLIAIPQYPIFIVNFVLNDGLTEIPAQLWSEDSGATTILESDLGVAAPGFLQAGTLDAFEYDVQDEPNGEVKRVTIQPDSYFLWTPNEN